MQTHLDGAPAGRRSMRQLARRLVPDRLATALARLGAWIAGAAERGRQRRALDRLDDRLLRDVGLSRRGSRSFGPLGDP